MSPTGTRQQITETVPTKRAIMSGQQQEKTRERTPANLGIKFNPALGAANLKRFYATVRALLKSNQESGATVPVLALRGQVQAKQPSCISPAQPSANS